MMYNKSIISQYKIRVTSMQSAAASGTTLASRVVLTLQQLPKS